MWSRVVKYICAICLQLAPKNSRRNCDQWQRDCKMLDKLTHFLAHDTDATTTTTTPFVLDRRHLESERISQNGRHMPLLRAFCAICSCPLPHVGASAFISFSFYFPIFASCCIIFANEFKLSIKWGIYSFSLPLRWK